MKPLVTVVAVLATLFAGFSGEVPREKDPEELVQEIVVQQRRILDALKSTKSEKDLQKLAEVVAATSEKMAETAKKLSAQGPFDDQAARSIWSAFATREYEALGDDTMGTAMQATPEALQPKIMQVLQGSMPALQAAEEAMGELLAMKNPGPRRERVRMPLEEEFVAAIATAHKNDPFADPTIAIVLSIFAEQRDGSSVVLFEQVIPWEAATPTDDDLRKWIDYAKDAREVTFEHPSGTFTHPLPKKR